MGKKKKEESGSPLAEENVAGADGVDENGQPDLADDAEAASDDAVDFEAEVARNKDLYLRALADLENFRKRAQREKEDAIRFANDNLLREMIPVIDNLERAVEHSAGDQDQTLIQGVQMTLEQFRKVLEAAGVKIVVALGAPFDPNFHQAMGQMVTVEQPPNTIIQELQKGYTLNGRLLRPAMVMVAKAPETEAAVAVDEDDVIDDEAEQGSDTE